MIANQFCNGDYVRAVLYKFCYLPPMLRPTSLATALLFSTMCACAPVPDASDYGVFEQAIVRGTATNGEEPATVLVFSRGGLCTGTLIASDVVLTAKHCVQRPGAEFPVTADSFRVGFGDFFGNISTARATEVWTPAGVWQEFGLSGLIGEDVALLRLEEEADITPIPIYAGDPTSFVGEEVRAVGFGQTEMGSSGRKFFLVTELLSVRPGVVSTFTTTCQGDSGGPLILQSEEAIIGVTSFGSARRCGDNDRSVFNRIDIFAEEVNAFIAGECAATGDTERCDGRDDDCDGEIDEDCLMIGQVCERDRDCRSLQCETLGENKLCTLECDIRAAPVGQCGDGFYCRREANDGFCTPGTAGDGLRGDSCEVDTDCASLRCESGRCTNLCRQDEGGCFAGEYCIIEEGLDLGRCSNSSDGPAGIGEPCEVAEDCRGGECRIEEGADGYCTHWCGNDTGCPTSMRCDQTLSECVPGGRSALGDPCEETSDCGDGLSCEAQDNRSICVSPCMAGECPGGFTCEMDLCLPAASPLGSSCGAGPECMSGLCSDDGICSQACSESNVCPADYVCVSDDNGNGECERYRPLPSPSEPGCSAAPSSTGFFPLLLLFLFFFRGSPWFVRVE